jgi:hypothetical protein
VREQKEYREMLRNLLDLDEGLTNWEITFLDDMNRWQGDFREKQAETIEKIWNKHF